MFCGSDGRASTRATNTPHAPGAVAARRKQEHAGAAHRCRNPRVGHERALVAPKRSEPGRRQPTPRWQGRPRRNGLDRSLFRAARVAGVTIAGAPSDSSHVGRVGLRIGCCSPTVVARVAPAWAQQAHPNCTRQGYRGGRPAYSSKCRGSVRVLARGVSANSMWQTGQASGRHRCLWLLFSSVLLFSGPQSRKKHSRHL